MLCAQTKESIKAEEEAIKQKDEAERKARMASGDIVRMPRCEPRCDPL